MEEEVQNEAPVGRQAYFSWEVKNRTEHERSRLWYIVMVSLAIVLLVYSVVTANFLFAMMIVLIVFIVILKEYAPARMIDFSIFSNGIQLGSKPYAYRDIKSFYVIYEPPMVKKLYFEFKSPRPDMSINLDMHDPIEIRNFLLQVLPENLEKEDQSLTDILDSFLKL